MEYWKQNFNIIFTLMNLHHGILWKLSRNCIDSSNIQTVPVTSQHTPNWHLVIQTWRIHLSFSSRGLKLRSELDIYCAIKSDWDAWAELWLWCSGDGIIFLATAVLLNINYKMAHVRWQFGPWDAWGSINLINKILYKLTVYRLLMMIFGISLYLSLETYRPP